MLPLALLSAIGCGWFESELPEIPDEPAELVVDVEEPDLEMPTDVPVMGDEIAEGGAAPQDPPDPNARPATPPDEWNPVSIPLGPREGTGVSWEGVKKSRSTREADAIGDPGANDRPPK